MSVLVTVAGPDGATDLELDDSPPVGQLLPALAHALGLPVPAALRTAAGAHLDLACSLAAAGVVDGHRLELVPAAASDVDTGRVALPPVLPCYLALDTSDSMAGPALDAVSAELARLWDAVAADPRLAAACRLAVVTFDAEARVHVPLSAPAAGRRPPRLAATRPATDFAAAFTLLGHLVADDLAALRASGLRPLRPAVFLLTDGRPTRGAWSPAHAALTDAAWPDAPDVVAFGFGDAAAAAVRRIGTAGAYLPASASGGGAPAPAGMLATFMSFLLAALGNSLAGPRLGLALPPEVPGGWRPMPSLTVRGRP